jgi:hypothetical protein
MLKQSSGNPDADSGDGLWVMPFGALATSAAEARSLSWTRLTMGLLPRVRRAAGLEVGRNLRGA